MVKIRILPYKQGSASAKVLAKCLNGKVLKLVGSKFIPKEKDVIVNWGSGNVPDFARAQILNQDVTKAQCKLSAFRVLLEAGVRVPTFSTKKDDWEDKDFPVVCRTKLRGHSGDGIVIAENRAELVDAPLYTKYVKKKEEYRVHVFRNKTFFVQRKARKHDVPEPNWKVRNLAGGFVFVEVGEDHAYHRDIIDQAEKSVEALGLDFGGVDVIWNEREGKAYVLEVNTACGLEERTAEYYAQAIRDFIEN